MCRRVGGFDRWDMIADCLHAFAFASRVKRRRGRKDWPHAKHNLGRTCRLVWRAMGRPHCRQPLDREPAAQRRCCRREKPDVGRHYLSREKNSVGDRIRYDDRQPVNRACSRIDVWRRVVVESDRKGLTDLRRRCSVRFERGDKLGRGWPRHVFEVDDP